MSAPGADGGAAPSNGAPEGVPLTFDEALAELVDFDKDGGLVWGGWGPPAAEQYAAAPSRTLYMQVKPHSRHSHVRAN